MSWSLCAGGKTLVGQVNKRWPKRDHASDGSIGDSAHAARVSDHNPDPRTEIVHATDIDKDFKGSPNDTEWFADQLIAYARTKKPGSDRLKNIVWWDQVASGTYHDTFWVFRGSGYGHMEHIHVSYTTEADKDGSEFDLPILSAQGGIWDKTVPYYDVLHRSMLSGEKNKATWRLACRLAELGFYEGTVLPEGEQGFPVKAVENMQEWMGWKIQPYSIKTHKSIWRELDVTPQS
jgi:hypothetical protein